METKHTPGPWTVSKRDPARFQVATVELFGIYSRHPEGGSFDCGKPEDDAKLIAAAPDLLEALQKLESAFMAHTQWNGEPPSEIKAARDAIKKATQ